MPTYLILSDCPQTKSNSSVCKDTTKFFGTLATKLLNMAESIHDRIERLKVELCPKPTKGFLLAEIDAPKMVLGIKYEFVEYVKRHGPPKDGKFDEQKLEIIRAELGISADSGVI